MKQNLQPWKTFSLQVVFFLLNPVLLCTILYSQLEVKSSIYVRNNMLGGWSCEQDVLFRLCFTSLKSVRIAGWNPQFRWSKILPTCRCKDALGTLQVRGCFLILLISVWWAILVVPTKVHCNHQLFYILQPCSITHMH